MSSWARIRRFSLRRQSKSLDVQPSMEVNEQPEPPSVPETQTVLLLHGAKQPYQVTGSYAVPQAETEHEVLLKVEVIGLNPIDWKAPDFNFGIPELPYVSGREFAGEVVKLPEKSGRLRIGDRVMSISTDYRDLRKAAYQQYAVAFDYNVVKLPPQVSVQEGATLGVAFVAAVLALGVSMGVDFSQVLDGPDLLKSLRNISPATLPEDIRGECLNGIQDHERAKLGDWLAIWGGSATSANLTIQLARLVGLKVIAIVDKAKHGLRLSNHKVLRPDLLVDSHDPRRAVDIIRANTKGKVRFGIDTRGRDTATHLLRTLTPDNLASVSAPNGSPPSPPATPQSTTLLSAHLIGLTGLPKGSPPEGVLYHTVPIKLFHEVPEIGLELVSWLERLLAKGLVVPPEILDVETGFESVNGALDRMRKGEISGGKLVVKVA
ncbi:chaperonin 10-like protein [Coniochaeta sp. 2T2.1]|nr:chaperonin 10-like protein [Coniochaeta sp. 2T2.1]